MSSKKTEQKRICASTARKEYNLSETDLSNLECDYVRNPHYRSAPQMRLYLESEVKEYAEKKAEQQKYNKEHADEIAKAAILAKQKKWENRLNDFSDGSVMMRDLENGNLELPYEVVNTIIGKLFDEYEPRGIRNLNSIVHDVLRISEASKDLCNVVRKYALPKLDGMIKSPLRAQIPWNTLVQNPMALKVRDLQAAARDVEAKISGKKIEVACNLLDAFELQKPCFLPAKIRWEIVFERCMHGGILASDVVCIASRLHTMGYVDEYTTGILSAFHAYNSVKRASLLREYGILNRKMLISKAEELGGVLQGMREKEKVQTGTQCNCGQKVSLRCANAVCGTCCRKNEFFCKFHS